MKFKTKENYEIYYEVINENSDKGTIVFLNGVMASVSSWIYQKEVFEQQGYKIILHDFVGQLKSDKFKGTYSFLRHANDVIELLNFLKIEKAHFIGTSYGGEVAMKLASTYPTYCESISVINSVSELDQQLIDKVSDWKLLARSKNGEVFFKGMMSTIYSDTFIKENKEMLTKRALAMNNVPASYYEGQIALYDTFLEDVYMTDELEKISCPSLIVCGELDTLKPMKFSQIMHENIKDSLYITIPNCAHVTIFEKPRALNVVLLGFIRDITN